MTILHGEEERRGYLVGDRKATTEGSLLTRCSIACIFKDMIRNSGS
jgi:hypothetical protein